MEKLRKKITPNEALKQVRDMTGRIGETRNRGPFEIKGIKVIGGVEKVDIEFLCLPWYRNNGKATHTYLLPETLLGHIGERWILYPEET